MPRSFARVLAILALALLSLTARNAGAHTVGLSRGVYQISGTGLVAILTFARGELALAVPHLEDAPTEEAGFELIASFVQNELQIWSHDERCLVTNVRVAAAEQDGVAVTMSYACRQVPTDLRIAARFVTRMASGHHHLAHVVSDGGVTDADLSRDTPAIEMQLTPGSPTAAASPWGRAETFVRMGIEHILTGYDHLLFLLGLLLVLGPVRSLIGAVSAFTVAHSLTLSLAVLGFWAPSPRFVEPAIALSIVYVGVENWFVRSAVGRWRITFVFGLIHGFGFAGALREIALPKAEVPLALCTFNLGVELGQLAVVAVVLPTLLFARRWGLLNEQRVRLASLPVAAMGMFWLVLRVYES